MAVTIKGTEGVSKVEATGTPSSSTFLRGDYAWAAIPAGASLSTASGSAPSYSARAWVNFNGTGTVAIRASGNVSSITDNGTGNYTVNFATAMPDADYAVSLQNTGFSLSNIGGNIVIAGTNTGGANLKSTTQLQLQTFANATGVSDYAEINCIIFR
tara:strand:- start:373 stop:843 length:471 start_codon:yes stop_codon:yes gene_type:complete